MDELTISQVENFAELVRRYCDWAENSCLNVKTDMQTAQKFLAELNLAVLNLPDNEFGDDVEFEDVTSEQWKIVKDRFAHLPIDGYWFVFDPSKAQENETVFGTLSEDLADIYRDIKYGLLLFEAGHLSEAAWEWKFNFKVHWGRHLSDAQKVIYCWLFENDKL